MKQMLVWIGALIVGTILGLLQIGVIDETANFVATVYVRLFQLLAVPTIVLAITTTLATLGSGPDAGRIFRHTISYTLLTTIVAAAVGLLLYVIIAPGNMQLPVADSELPIVDSQVTYTDHLLSVIPNNIVKPFLEGNVLSLLILAAAIGIALSQIADTPQKKTVVNFLQGVQEVLFTLIRGLIVILPVGIVAFAAQLSAQLSAGVIADSLGKYVAVVLGGNLLQFFVVLPIFLLTRHLNP
ncbi:MAG: cation:dicarboxylase symporter family transporter, partial [Prevotella sp.]|nr:cation:dicarboxylase symporter family transporter [Prevotella sp.]